MKKTILSAAVCLTAMLTAGAQVSAMGFVPKIDINMIMPAIDFSAADDMAKEFHDKLFEDEESVIKESIGGADISEIQVGSLYGALYIEASADADIHLEYPESANFTLNHEITDGVLSISASVYTPGNSDVLKVFIPLGTVKAFNLTGGTSMVHFTGQDKMLESLDIDASMGMVVLENIYADVTVKTGTGTIRLQNDTIKSNISLKSDYGVIDVGLGELPDDVSIYTKGGVQSNTMLSQRDAVSLNEKYALRIENSVGGINIHKK